MTEPDGLLYDPRTGHPYGGEPPHAAGSWTSRYAAQNAKSKEMQKRILALLERHGPLDDDQIGEKLGCGRYYSAPARCELTVAGYVVETGVHHRNHNGNPVTVWRIIRPDEEPVPRKMTKVQRLRAQIEDLEETLKALRSALNRDALSSEERRNLVEQIMRRTGF